MDLQNFGDDENRLACLVNGQSLDLDFQFSEAMEALDVGGTHLGSHGIQCGLHEDDDISSNFMIFYDNSCAVDSWCGLFSRS